MKQYIQSIVKLFRRQPNVSISEEKDTITVFVDYSDVGEDAKYWIKDTISKVENKVRELRYLDHDCNELVYVKFKLKEEFRKQQLTHETVFFTLEEINNELDRDLHFHFPLKWLGLDLYLKEYEEKDLNTVSLAYNFWSENHEPRLVIEGKWVKLVQEEYDSFEKRIKGMVQSLKEKIILEIKNTPNWETLDDDDPIRVQILDKYAIQEPYTQEIEKKLENI